ncbi:type II toxin-antitoxin system death-on-curing family toxin [Campylobacter geochelonis]|uniref:type II toxin-antitoxin system death-on-curing family toxin n=1 Tax=Campylobacter geochelonis TaxID=1780362 RepID=UPI000770A0A6|nr:type II toxin-antitoxin system death-on-curing family toxin [Campylobacter geochelonis]CZE47043.1 death-on-curing family protein [Campylobacter geochelonis]
MKYLTLKQAIEFHEQIIATSGGLGGYNEIQLGYLDSALKQIQNDDYYSDFIEKLTHLIHSCIKFHPFLDGNKRTSIQLGRAFIEMNFPGADIDDYYLNMEDIVVGVAEGKIAKESLYKKLQEMVEVRIKGIKIIKKDGSIEELDLEKLNQIIVEILTNKNKDKK